MILDIYLTNACNLRCVYCYLKGKNQEKSNTDLIEKILNYFLEFEYEDSNIYCTFIGGEPLLKFSLIKEAVKVGKEIAKKKKRKIFFNLVTNGTLLNNQRIDFLKRNNFYVVLSFDGDKKTQDQQRSFCNGTSCFQLVKNNLIKLNKVIPNIIVRMTVTPSSAKSLAKNVEFFLSKNIDRIGFVPVYEGNWSNDDIQIFKKNVKKVIEIWAKNIKKHSNFYIMPLLDYLKTWKIENFNFHPYMHLCQLGNRSRYSISVKGDIYPCHRFASLQDKKFKLGNIFQGGVEKQTEKKLDDLVYQIRRNVIDYGCPALNYECNKDPKVPLENYQRIKSIFLDVIVDVYKDKKYRDFLKHLNNF